MHEPQLIEFITVTLGQKLPASTNDVNRSKYVVAKKQGLELLFSHDILNEKYPLIPKGKTAFVPYLSLVRPTQKFPEPLPFGVALGMSPELISFSGSPRAGDPNRWQADIGKLTSLGFRPAVALIPGVSAYAAWAASALKSATRAYH